MSRDELKRILQQSNNNGMICISKKLIEFLDNANQAILISQLIYWGDKIKNNNGWIYKTNLEFSKETGMSTNKIRYAKKSLENRKFIQTEVHNISNTTQTFYRISEFFLDEFNKFCNTDKI